MRRVERAPGRRASSRRWLAIDRRSEFRIGNRGGAPFEGVLGIHLEQPASELTFEITLGLASGELSDVIEGPEQDGGDAEARIVLEAPDCQDEGALALYLVGGAACRL